MSNYVVAIPSYNRVDEVIHKTLHTLKEANIPKSKIYVFVANKQQYKLYEESVPKQLYGHLIIGKKGIVHQRKFITTYFPEGQYVISMDDDIECFEILHKDKLIKLTNLHGLFMDAYRKMKAEHLYLWGVYPVRNPFYMYEKTTDDLRFIIGVVFGYIVRHDKSLLVSLQSESKDDYEQTILYYKKDGGVIRYNNITTKTKLGAPGGLGTNRMDKSRRAAEYLVKTYPDIVSRNDRQNGTPEVKLKRMPRQ